MSIGDIEGEVIEVGSLATKLRTPRQEEITIPYSVAAVLSELHAQIQDAFNEYGTQIMSPHFESQPEKPVFVPKSAWHAAPAAPADSLAVPLNFPQEAKKTGPSED